MPADDQLTGFRLERIEETLTKVSDSLATLAGLEIRHVETREGLGRAHGRIDDHETRLRKVEGDMPNLRLTSKWVLAAMAGIIALIGIALFKFLVK